MVLGLLGPQEVVMTRFEILPEIEIRTVGTTMRSGHGRDLPAFASRDRDG